MRALRPIRPPVAIERAYHKKLKAMLKEMDRSLYYWLRAEYRKAEPEIVGDSALADMRTKMKHLARYWKKKYNENAVSMAEWFATEVQKHTTRNLQNQMKNAKLAELGFDLDFKYHSRKERAVFNAIVEQNANLIKSIASEHLTKVQGIVLRGIETGHDLSQMTDNLEESFGVTERRAALIARDQTAKASNNLSRQRLMDYGVTKGRWMHTASGKTYRDSHVEMDGEIYDIEQGRYDDDYGDYVQPGELVNCHCVCIPVIDFGNETANDSAMVDYNEAHDPDNGQFTSSGGGGGGSGTKSKFDRKRKRKPVKVSKREYAHVTSELNTHLSKDERAKSILVKHIGNYKYVIENNGFDNYNILSRSRLK